MGQNNGSRDNEFVGISTSAADPNNGGGVINVWGWDNGSGQVKTSIVGGSFKTETVSADSVSIGGVLTLVNDNGLRSVNCDKFNPSNAPGSNCRWVYSATLGGYVLSTSTSLK